MDKGYEEVIHTKNTNDNKHTKDILPHKWQKIQTKIIRYYFTNSIRKHDILNKTQCQEWCGDRYSTAMLIGQIIICKAKIYV